MKKRITTVAAALAVGGAVLAGGLTATAQAATTSTTGTVAMTCSTTKLSSTRARGWCTGGSSWRVGVRCTDGLHYYSPWTTARGYRYAACGNGTITHYWIDN